MNKNSFLGVDYNKCVDTVYFGSYIKKNNNNRSIISAIMQSFLKCQCFEILTKIKYLSKDAIYSLGML